MKHLTCFALLFSLLAAVPARPGFVTKTQPDGTPILLRLRGDEWNHWYETRNGYTVALRPGAGWEYVSGFDSGPTPRLTGVPAQDAPPPGLVPHLRPPHRNHPDYRQRRPHLPQARTQFEIPLLLIEYPNLAHSYPQAEFDSLLNQIGYVGAHGPTGSFRDYYRENSYGAFDPHTNVSGWYMADSNYQVYGSDAPNGWEYTRQMIARAVDDAEAAGMDWSQFDNDGDGYVDDLNIIHAGGGAEEGNGQYIWSHSWSLQGYARTYDGVTIDHYTINPELQGGSNPGLVNIGVICHEFGHALGLPDLYDTDYSSSGIGIWGLMAAGSWGGNGNSAWYPSHLSAWSKKTLGWLTPTVVTDPILTLDFPPVEQVPFVVQIAGDSPEWEYFLLENRQHFGSDTTLRSTGLLIWHIDESQWGNTEDFHYLVDLEQADGLYELNLGTSDGDPGDPFPGSFGNTRFGYDTNPNSRYYSGQASGVSVVDIADLGDTMRATIRNIPTLAFDSLSVAYDFGDGDGVFNPGETVGLVVSLVNPSDTEVQNLVATVFPPPGLALTDSTITFGTLPAFGSADNLVTPLEIAADSLAPLGTYSLQLELTGTVDTSAFDQTLIFPLDLSITQTGFPIDLPREAYAAPTVVDLDGDGEREILTATYAGEIRVYQSDGTPAAGQWPFQAGDQIWNSPAVADLDGDGDLELVVTSKSKHAFILNHDGGIATDFSANQFLVASPAVGNLDDDSELEIVFGSVANDGKLFALNPDGSAVPGFPVQINEKIYAGVALGDVNQDGKDEIFAVTKSGSLYRLQSQGQIANGFPLHFDGYDFRTPPVLIQGADGGWVLVVHDRTGHLVAVNERGELRFDVPAGGFNDAGVAVATQGTVTYLVTGDQDGQVYLFDLDGNVIDGFPVSVSGAVSGTPAVTDLDQDGVLDLIVGTESGTVEMVSATGAGVYPSPVHLADELESPATLADLDQDGDVEVCFGGLGTLQVQDFKRSGSLQPGDWSMDRANYLRNGRVSSPQLLTTTPIAHLPLSFGLHRVYPNPFNPVTTIQYSLLRAGSVRLTVYDLQGRKVRSLVHGWRPSGTHTVRWDGKNDRAQTVAGGLYFIRLESDGASDGAKVLLLK